MIGAACKHTRRGSWTIAAITLATALFGAHTAWTVSAASSAHAEGSGDVLSLGGSVTEIVAALGQEHRLKARDTTSSYPPSVTDLPDVGYVRALSPEGVLAVNPSLIVAEEGAGPPEALEVIRAARIEYVEVPEAYSRDGILRKIEVVGDALGVSDRAEDLARKVGADLSTAMTKAERAEADKRRVLFIISANGGKITASGSGTAADAIIRMAGGVNAVTSFDGYKQMSDEALAAAAPDAILMMDRSGDHAVDDEELLSLPAMRLTPAAETRDVIRIDGMLLLGFGPRTAQAVTELSGALYGGEG
ncbi:iron complex transport system substrate-binding protein [Roseivivax halotolerans]|uniref:Iron complex transport system substrate-binding protein n=1 Tax=Roseivivax halotolerans TaxID=93684 RepID=A0A1I5Z8F0_9RHOB|nr:ABC transporter substrate-binding protein [Roseivivax halotolerans]SFQ52645.1 iron complex transport system substrate-binding protein [Roseivivax halotolerans]